MAEALQIRLPAKLASTEESGWPRYLDDADLYPGGWICLTMKLILLSWQTDLR
jgi:hypothetical protein